MRIASSVLVSMLAVVGCKTDATQKAPAAQAGSGSAAAGSAAGSAGSGSAAGSATAPAPQVGEKITLPKGTGAPPKATAKKFEAADFERLAKLEFPGFKSEVREQAKALDVRHSTPRPVIATTVTVTGCLDCPKMELAAWKAREAGLKQLLSPELRDKPDTIWEIGQAEINGTPVIWTYQLGHHFGKDEAGNPVGAFSNAYILYFNDGNNQIRVVTEYKDDPVAREDLTSIAPRADLERVARAFLDHYTQAWAP